MPPSTDRTGCRLHHTLGEGGGYCRIDGIAAHPEDLQSGLSRKWVPRRNHAARRACFGLVRGPNAFSLAQVALATAP